MWPDLTLPQWNLTSILGLKKKCLFALFQTTQNFGLGCFFFFFFFFFAIQFCIKQNVQNLKFQNTL